jgi:peptidoglycan DL-endopeptidase CwlO
MARTRQNTAAAAAAETAAQQERDLQAACDSVLIENMRTFVAAQNDATEAKRVYDAAVVNVGNVKIAIMLKLAEAANRLKWTAAQIKNGLDAAMLVWAGNENTEAKLASPVARRLRSEFNLAMLPTVCGKAAQVVEAAAVAWKEETEARAADPNAPMPLHDKFWNRPAELQLHNLRALKEEKVTRGRGKDKVTEVKKGTGVALLTRADMVDAIKAAPVAPLDAAAADVKKFLADWDAFATKYASEEALQPVRELFTKTATAAALVARLRAKEAGQAAPPAAPPAAPAPAAPAPAAPAPAAPAIAPDPIAGASNIDMDRLADMIAQRMMTKSGN